MIPVRRCDLAPGTMVLLQRRQAAAAGLAAGSKKIQGKWDYFLAHDKAEVADVRENLERMFADICCYCEKAVARDIEHFQPKTRYPGTMFQWDNLLRACKDCNFEKNDVDPLSASGNRWLLDPTQDNHEVYFHWDLESGAPVYVGKTPGVPHRAEDTLVACGVDHQTHNEERRVAANWALYLLLRAVEEDPLTEASRRTLQDLFGRRRARKSVLRQIVLDPENADLIAAVERKLPELIPPIEHLRYRHP